MRTSLFILFIGLCMVLLSACESSTSGTDYYSMAYQDAIDNGIDPTLFTRQINQESGFDPNAVSSAGAVGIAQFLPSTASGLGINPYDPSDALRSAAQLMSRYQAQYGDYQHGLAAYNCGSSCLQSAMANCSYYYWCLPGETQRYINKIMGGAI
jgi:soluble lytic murein transglycosylase-like protein